MRLVVCFTVMKQISPFTVLNSQCVSFIWENITKDLRVQFNAKQFSTAKFSFIRNIYGTKVLTFAPALNTNFMFANKYVLVVFKQQKNLTLQKLF